MERTLLVGVISDTHGLLRPEAIAALGGCDRIIHAGDLGKAEILEQLTRIAPTVAVRGNVDRGSWADALPETLTLAIQGVRIHVLHDVHALAMNPSANRIDVVISGHSHRPVNETKAGVLFLNPGSAGPRRFSLPVTVAKLKIRSARIKAEIVDLSPLSRVSA